MSPMRDDDDKRTVKIELLSQLRLEAEYCNFHPISTAEKNIRLKPWSWFSLYKSQKIQTLNVQKQNFLWQICCFSFHFTINLLHCWLGALREQMPDCVCTVQTGFCRANFENIQTSQGQGNVSCLPHWSKCPLPACWCTTTLQIYKCVSSGHWSILTAQKSKSLQCWMSAASDPLLLKVD